MIKSNKFNRNNKAPTVKRMTQLASATHTWPHRAQASLRLVQIGAQVER